MTAWGTAAVIAACCVYLGAAGGLDNDVRAHKQRLRSLTYGCQSGHGCPRWDAWDAPIDKASFSVLMATEVTNGPSKWWNYAYPEEDKLTSNVSLNWVPHTSGCHISTNCWCFHVQGDMDKKKNPGGWKSCVPFDKTLSEAECAAHKLKDTSCCCLTGPRCLFSDMRPSKIISVLTAARLAGITRIVEEGRFGGLSAYMYSLFGFEVISLELVPLDGPTNSLRELAPDVKLVTGNGAEILPTLLTPEDASRTMVIFDGEKRLGAYKTYQKIKHLIAVAVFDDSNIGDDPKVFVRTLNRNNEVWWDTIDALFYNCIRHDAVGFKLLQPLKNVPAKKCRIWHGGVNDLSAHHFAIVRAPGWSGNATYGRLDRPPCRPYATPSWFTSS